MAEINRKEHRNSVARQTDRSSRSVVQSTPSIRRVHHKRTVLDTVVFHDATTPAYIGNVHSRINCIFFFSWSHGFFEGMRSTGIETTRVITIDITTELRPRRLQDGKVRSRLWDRRAPGSKPDSTEDPQCMGPVARYIRSGQMSSRWCGVEVWRGDASSGVALVI
ncbi:hypothetical protein AVEN_96154-1 [Araneus ventricosus]|uniref:Uncharacterized protein n=1 Tax=Araneus ventricosus TaxID=182803 RepID=A0A4Y2MEP6_ARAVE|nr:hypothetical protein AVEN_96154-1 [Araneus ventricosus]